MQKIIVSVSPPPLSAFKIPTESPKKKNKKTRPKRSALLFFFALISTSKNYFSMPLLRTYVAGDSAGLYVWVRP